MLDKTPQQKRLGIVLGICVLVLAGIGLVMLFPSENNQGYSPEQPIPFSHKLHAGQYKIPCQYCHVNAERSAHATVPAVATCMNCHSVVKTDSPHIKKLRNYYDRNEPIPWVRIHELPDHAHFTHKRHIKAGLACQTCHGPVEQMDKVYQYSPLNMGWCMQCHRGETTPKDVKKAKFHDVQGKPDARGREPVAPIQCNTCHY